MTTRYSFFDGPEGPLLLAVDDEGNLVRLHFAHDSVPVGADWIRDDAALDGVRTQLDEYFAGTRTEFDLPLRLHGTPFQVEVWEQLRRIPYGETISYGELARRVDRPEAARAVGAANGQNPVAIVVPCHRVIGADGSLTGFGGGLDWKRWLLQREQPQGSLIA
ncbi:MAG: methylated-DNA--[protein]-cysteine S-methyltransferase [Acidimicrobiia bacterium]